MTPLMTCLDDGRFETARILIKLGADVNLTDRWGTTALMYAARQGLADVTTLLLQGTVDINAADTADGFNAMDWAILRKHEDVIAILRRAGGLAKER
jgi:ankyrin repeat protein